MEPLDLAAIFGISELSTHVETVGQQLAGAVASENPYLHKPISRIFKSRGKRLRPSLIIAIAAANGKRIDETVIAGCVAIELVHIASLVHDDIIDDAASRRNIPTINSTEGLASAIVAGDYLLACAFQEAAKINTEASKVIASAFAAICDGQARELSDDHNMARTRASYKQAIHGKTASLFAATCRIGGLCAGLNQAQIAALAHYGENFGMAFQLIDDVLDFVSAPELSGKPVGNDIKEGVYTLPLILALAGPHGKKVRQLLKNNSDISRLSLVDMLVQHDLINETISGAQGYNGLAVDALQGLGSNGANLARLPEAYVSWSLKNLVAPAYRSAVGLEVLADVAE
jgi:heptaprenyl diphosphate synthase